MCTTYTSHIPDRTHTRCNLHLSSRVCCQAHSVTGCASPCHPRAVQRGSVCSARPCPHKPSSLLRDTCCDADIAWRATWTLHRAWAPDSHSPHLMSSPVHTARGHILSSHQHTPTMHREHPTLPSWPHPDVSSLAPRATRHVASYARDSPSPDQPRAWVNGAREQCEAASCAGA